MEYKNRIYELRKKHGFSQEQLADKLGVARQTVSKWEIGETSPDIKQAQAIAKIFNVSLDELMNCVLHDTDEQVDLSTAVESKKHKLKYKKWIIVAAAAICLCLVVVGICNVIARVHILHPQSSGEDVVVSCKGAALLSQGSVCDAVFDEANKPVVKCKLPDGFVQESAGLYTDGRGSYIRINSDFAQNVINPLAGTDYLAYYEACGYSTYMDVVRKAMYVDVTSGSVFSSKEKLYLVGGARIVTTQLCAGQNVEYYELDGGLTTDGAAMRLFGFALSFNDNVWLITLKDCNDVYYFITVRDADGVGKSIDSLAGFLSTFYVEE